MTSSHCLSRHLYGGRGGYPLDREVAGKGLQNPVAAACGFAQAILTVPPGAWGRMCLVSQAVPKGRRGALLSLCREVCAGSGDMGLAWSWPMVQFRAHSFSFPERPVASRERSTGIPQSLPDVPSDPQKQPGEQFISATPDN